MQWTPCLVAMSQVWTPLKRTAVGSLLGMGHSTMRAERELWVVSGLPFLCDGQETLGRHQINHGGYKHSEGSMKPCWSHGKRDCEGQIWSVKTLVFLLKPSSMEERNV